MKVAVLILTGVSILSAETFPVTKGTLTINVEGITYEAKKEKNSRQWKWLDIQHLDRVSETELVILTYEDRKRYLGRDRSYRFTLTGGAITDELFRNISNWLGRPVTNRVIREPKTVQFSAPAKHSHTFGGCEGDLEFTGDTVYYVTDHAKDIREWQLNRDIASIWSANPYHLELHVYENNRREFSKTRTWQFHLKQPLDREFYKELKLRLHEVASAR